MDSGLAAALRIVSGFAGAAGAGWVALDVFHAFGLAGPARISALDPSRPGFQCLSTGLLFAAMLAFVRVGKPAVCLLLAVAASAMQFGLNLTSGLPRVVTRPLWMAVVAATLILAALVYDALARSGHRFGKFLVVGPVVAGIYFFATPLLLLGGQAVQVQHGLLHFDFFSQFTAEQPRFHCISCTVFTEQRARLIVHIDTVQKGCSRLVTSGRACVGVTSAVTAFTDPV